MKRIASILALASLCVLVAAPAVEAAGAAKPVSLTGYIADETCGKANANPAGKDCTLACVKAGAKLVLVSGDKLYRLSDQKTALQNVGHEVTVTGTLTTAGLLQVESIRPTKATKKA